MKTENLSTLKIHRLTQEQYNRELEAGRIDENALYLTPDEGSDLSQYATTEQVEATYETKTDASAKLTEAKEYTNTQLANQIPTKISELTNDAGYLNTIPDEYVTDTELNAKGYLTEHQSLSGYATETYVNNAINSIPTPDVSGQIGSHNTATDAHNDIRLLVEGLNTRLNALANSTDEDLDQMAEIVAYIKSNKELIDAITTSKVNVADIIDNLTTNVSNKPLSAAQGVALKALIDAITVPTKVSELTNDKGYLTSFTETDPTVPAWAKAATKPSYTAAEVGALPLTGGTMTGAIDFKDTSQVLDFGTSGYFRGLTASGNRFDILGLVNSTTFRVGGSYPALALLGKNARPTYNGADMALHSDIPTKTDTWTATYEDGTVETIEVYVK